MTKIISARQAAGLLRDGMTVGVSGFGAFASPDSILEAIREKFREENSPRDLTIVSGVAPGDFVEDGCGLSKIRDEGIISTLIASHLRMSPAIGRACSENKIAAFSMPLGVYGQLMAAIGGKRPGILTHVGLNTYADPRQDGCKMNDLAKAQDREIVELVRLDGRDYLFYKAFPIDVCILHASYADADGNISLQDEPVHGDLLELALAVHNNGGTVIVEVKDILEPCSLDPRHVLIPKFSVDYIVKAQGENNIALAYHPEMTGDLRAMADSVKPLPFSYKKVIARRAAMELKKGDLVNLGIGIPASVANVANEEGLSRDVTLSLETGVYGGVPLDGPLFGAAVNPDSISRSADAFTVYDGGGLNMTVLGCAEIDMAGNVNVSKFSGRCVGPGGFVNISQNTPKVCFAFAFTAGKCDIAVEGGKLVIRNDGKAGKFIKACDHISFSSQFAQETNQTVLFITERAVFELRDRKLILTEIAPGIDMEKDVLRLMGFRPEISPELKLMDERLFRPGKMGLSFGE
ncbi:MAG: 3-oxoacid CoA-transferase [Clostridia bacterium]|nr:MAG: 3-oxoacid CoA-transferase [Clostridia bacterium]